MSGKARGIRIAFGALVAAALGYGATEALAAPPAAEARLACDDLQCANDCVEAGGSWGVCRRRNTPPFEEYCQCID